ncbi:hypothetical protein LT330_009508 [Penicillium expansum]|nr:hypothetical protein LT330_009508 [Penicillium expansum]
MDTIVGPEALVILLDPDPVIFAQKRRHVAIRSGPSARDASPRALNANTIRHDELVVDQEIAELEREYLNWDVPENDLAAFSNLETSGTNQYPWTGGSLVLSPIDQEFQFNLPIAANWSMPASPTPNPHSLTKRPKVNVAIERTAKLLLHTLKSYVLTMLRHNSLPPFIHPSLVYAEFSMEPLVNCINLVHMISGEMKGNRKLFWRNVRMECERLCNEGPTLSKWELLAAMQALAIYIIIRLDDGETEYNGFDTLLIAAVTVVAQNLTKRDIAGKFSLDGSWKDWLFEESRRRLSIIYKVFNMLFYFEPATMCNLPTDLVLAPLPAKKQLWEAENEATWKSESRREGEVQTEFGLTGSGDLVKLGENHRGTVMVHTSITENNPARTTASWEEWCEGMDGFGGLVMLAASMVV